MEGTVQNRHQAKQHLAKDSNHEHSKGRKDGETAAGRVWEQHLKLEGREGKKQFPRVGNQTEDMNDTAVAAVGRVRKSGFMKDWAHSVPSHTGVKWRQLAEFESNT